MFYRCKCGRAQAWSSMGVSLCDVCPDCGSNLALGPDSHRDPAPHDMALVQEIATDQGKATITRCRHCHLTAAEIAERDERRGSKP